MTAIGKIALASVFSVAMIGSASAAADFSGTYQSVASKSSWSNGEFPKNFSLMIQVKFEGNKVIYHSVNANSPAANLDYTAPLDGTVIPMTGNARFNQIRVKQQRRFKGSFGSRVVFDAADAFQNIIQIGNAQAAMRESEIGIHIKRLLEEFNCRFKVFNLYRLSQEFV